MKFLELNSQYCSGVTSKKSQHEQNPITEKKNKK